MILLINIWFIYLTNFVDCEDIQTEWLFNQSPNYAFKAEYYENKKYSNINQAIQDSSHEVERWRRRIGIPGVAAGVSIKGKEVWTEGFGYTDIENEVKTRKDSIFRVASISKAITSGLVGKLIDEQKLDLNKSIYEYLPKNLLPVKKWEGIEAKITLRQVMSHTAGFRVTKVPDDFLRIKKAENVSQTLELFRNDELLFEPGKNFSYSNYGYQVVGAVIESVIDKGNTYETEINKMFAELGMNLTTIDRREKVVAHRSRYYERRTDKNNVTQVINTDIVDDLAVYDGWWPAGGVITTASDLLKFGNAMLTSFLGKEKGIKVFFEKN
jgi:serine beta-lactamase-like protein LACTB